MGKMKPTMLLEKKKHDEERKIKRKRVRRKENSRGRKCGKEEK